jgi:hypothetical protein
LGHLAGLEAQAADLVGDGDGQGLRTHGGT